MDQSIIAVTLIGAVAFSPEVYGICMNFRGDSTLLPPARKYTEAIREAENLTWHHDIGFIINCSFGNGWRLTKDTTYPAVIIQAAKSRVNSFS